MKGHGLDRLVSGAFWTLCVLCLLGLNEVAFMWLGIERALSPVMLLCCLAMLSGLLRVSLRDALGGMGVLLMAALVSYIGIGTLVAVVSGMEWRTDAFWYLRRYASSVLLILAVAVGGRIVMERTGGERTLLVILALLTASCALMLTSPWLLLIFPTAPPDGRFRHFGPFQSPNEAGFVACLAVVLAFSYLRAGRFSVMAYGSLLVAVSALVGTFSRTALVTLPLVAAGGVLVGRGAERWRLLAGMLVISWVGVRTWVDATAGALLDPQVARLDSLLTMVESLSVDDVTLAGRLTLWEIGTELAMASPLYGYGLGRFHALEEAWYNDDGVLLGVHNQYLTLWGEAGVVPLLLFVFFLVGMLRLGWRRDTEIAVRSAASGWAMVILVNGLSAHGLLLSRASTFILGISCAAAAFAASRRQDADASRAMESVAAPAAEHGKHSHSTVLSDPVPGMRGLGTSTVGARQAP